MKPPSLSLLMVALAASAMGQSTTIVSDPLGFNSIVCPRQSDTIVGVPFRPNGSRQGALASVPPAPVDDHVTLSIAGSPSFAADEFKDTHHVKFTSGNLNGHFFPITGNTANQLTIFLNGNPVAAGLPDDTLVIARYWTLNSLFPPAAATTDATTTGHAIVAWLSESFFDIRSELLLPDLVTPGTNLAPSQSFYILNGAWRKKGNPSTEDWGAQQLHPDSYFIIRHTSSVTTSTTMRCMGEVDLYRMAIPLSTQSNRFQDNFIAVPRPLDLTLDQLGLVPGAFAESPSEFIFDRKDELFTFDNNAAAFNRAASARYYYYNGAWRDSTLFGSPDKGSVVIPAGVGFMIRKAPTTDGATVFWNNPATYQNQP